MENIFYQRQNLPIQANISFLGKIYDSIENIQAFSLEIRSTFR